VRPTARTVWRRAVTGSGEASQARLVTPRHLWRWRRIRWQRFARIGLAIGLIGFGTAVFLGVRDRVEPVAARAVIDRADPDAVIESTGIEFVQTAGGQENFAVEATRQLTYSDGSVRFVDGITLRVSGQADRDSFVMTGTEASVNGAETEVEVSGDVRLAVSDGLGVRTGAAAYTTDLGIITMPGATTLTRPGLEASGRHVVYDGHRGVIDLREAAQVLLIGEGERASVDITSTRAILAHADHYMYFDGASEVRTGPLTLESDETTAYFGDGETSLERLELRGSARIRSTSLTSGGLSEMGASEMTLAFEETSRVLERTILVGDAAIELVGFDTGRGARIDATTMDVTIADGGHVSALIARDGVRLVLPATSDGARQEIRAVTLTGSGLPDSGLNAVRFDSDVEYREEPAGGAASRMIRAERLEAGVGQGLSALVEARFLGEVRFEDDTRQAEADEAVYDVIGGVFTLNSGGDSGRAPRLTNGTTTIEASRIQVTLDGSSIEASEGVKSVLIPGGDTAESTSATMPALLDAAQQIFVTAEALQYDGGTGQATYTGQARLWQGETSFQGNTLSIDDQTGSLSATGNVRTIIPLIRLNEATEHDVSLTRAEADTFIYDDSTNRAVYGPMAVLRSEYGDLQADTIMLFLATDGRTLDRLEASGNVKLRLADRWATGENLVYYETEGRYEMEGNPVEIVEEVAPEQTDETSPPDPVATPVLPFCRSTRGRALTFYRSTDAVAVDGREELRTQTTRGTCTPLVFE